MRHKHHIVPRHAGGTDDESNIVELTIEEHADAHNLLYCKYGRWQDKLAEQMLLGMIGHEEGVKLAQSRGGKINKGANNCNAKLDENDVSILKYYILPHGRVKKETRDEFGINVSAICKIRNGSRWSHV